MSIRLRLAAVFTAAAAILFTLGSWAFVAGLSSSLLGAIDTQLAARISTASRYLPGHGPAAPTAGLAPGDYVVQVIDRAGRVRGGSPEAGRTPLVSAAQITQARGHRLVVTQTTEDERERLMAAPLTGHPGWVAVAAVSLESYDAAISDVVRNLLIAGAIFVAAAGLGSYGLARAALSPVERLRREVAALSEHGQAPGAPAPHVQVPRTRDEIAALAATMNQLLGRLHLALTRQRALVADASHELRTPFAVLRGELELAGRPGRSREELVAAVAQAGEEAARLARITEQLLFLARTDEDMAAVRRQATDLRAVLAGSAGAGRAPRGRGRGLLRRAGAGRAGRLCRPRSPARSGRQPGRQRAPVRPASNVDRAGGQRGRPGPGRGDQRRRPRLPGGLPAARLRALPAPGLGPGPGRRRGRPRTGHCQCHRPRARRPGHRREQARRRGRGHARAARRRPHMTR